MSAKEFLDLLWADPDWPWLEMDDEAAAADLAWMRESGVAVPEGMTVEEYRDAWNDKVHEMWRCENESA